MDLSGSLIMASGQLVVQGLEERMQHDVQQLQEIERIYTPFIVAREDILSKLAKGSKQVEDHVIKCGTLLSSPEGRQQYQELLAEFGKQSVQLQRLRDAYTAMTNATEEYMATLRGIKSVT